VQGGGWVYIVGKYRAQERNPWRVCYRPTTPLIVEHNGLLNAMHVKNCVIGQLIN